MRGRSEGLVEVRLADSTLSMGEPCTWGSGQRKLNCSGDTWAPYNGRLRSSIQREGNPVMPTGLEQIAAEARQATSSRNLEFRSWMATLVCWHQVGKLGFPLQRPKLMLPLRHYPVMLCCESTFEERSAGNPHATFCGNRRRVTASDDPVDGQ